MSGIIEIIIGIIIYFTNNQHKYFTKEQVQQFTGSVRNKQSYIHLVSDSLLIFLLLQVILQSNMMGSVTDPL